MSVYWSDLPVLSCIVPLFLRPTNLWIEMSLSGWNWIGSHNSKTKLATWKPWLYVLFVKFYSTNYFLYHYADFFIFWNWLSYYLPCHPSLQVNVDEKIRFLTDHHHDLLNQRAALDVRLKEAKSMGRETAAQHIAAEVSDLFFFFHDFGGQIFCPSNSSKCKITPMPNCFWNHR